MRSRPTRPTTIVLYAPCIVWLLLERKMIDGHDGRAQDNILQTTVCQIRRAPALLLSEQNLVRAEGLEPSWAV